MSDQRVDDTELITTRTSPTTIVSTLCIIYTIYEHTKTEHFWLVLSHIRDMLKKDVILGAICLTRRATKAVDRMLEHDSTRSSHMDGRQLDISMSRV